MEASGQGVSGGAGGVPASGVAVRDEVMRQAMGVAGEIPRPQPRAVLCPYCGSLTGNTARCTGCGGRFDPLSRQATQNHMGPWAIRDERSPHRPGCTYETLCRLVDSGAVGLDTVVRGPSTRQFWTLARHAPGVASRLGVCHNCRAEVKKDAFSCPSCHASFGVDRDRQHMGVGPVRPLPGQGTPEVLALHAGPARSPATEPRDFTRSEGGGADSVGGLAAASAAVSQAQSAAARWKYVSDLDRQRGVIALVLAAMVVLTSLVYAGMVADRARNAEPTEASVGTTGGG